MSFGFRSGRMLLKRASNLMLAIGFATLAQLSLSLPTHAQTDDWKSSFQENAMDGSKSIMLREQHLMGMHDEDLTVMCGPRLEVYVSTNSIITESFDDGAFVPVRIRFNDGRATRQSWSRSTDFHAAFSSSPKSLVLQMKKSKTFYFEYTPFQETSAVSMFSLEGLNTELSKYYECRRLGLGGKQ